MSLARSKLHGRIYGFNTSVAIVWAELFAKLERAEKKMPLEIATSQLTRYDTVSRSRPAMRKTFFNQDCGCLIHFTNVDVLGLLRGRAVLGQTSDW